MHGFGASVKHIHIEHLARQSFEPSSELIGKGGGETLWCPPNDLGENVYTVPMTGKSNVISKQGGHLEQMNLFIFLKVLAQTVLNESLPREREITATMLARGTDSFSARVDLVWSG